MSAFIVDEKTITRVVSLFHAYHNDPRQGRKYPAELGPIKVEKTDDLRKLGQALWIMNGHAVDQRYEENNAVPIFGNGADPTGKSGPISIMDVGKRNGFVPQAFTGPSDMIQALKSARCLLYQCAEGDVPESDLFKALEQFSLQVAMRIISSLPEYDRADWS